VKKTRKRKTKRKTKKMKKMKQKIMKHRVLRKTKRERKEKRRYDFKQDLQLIVHLKKFVTGHDFVCFFNKKKFLTFIPCQML